MNMWLKLPAWLEEVCGNLRRATAVATMHEQKLWEEVLGDNFLPRPRLSRIYYRKNFES